MGTFTKGKKYIFQSTGSSSKCVTYDRFIMCPTTVRLSFHVFADNFEVEVTNNYSTYYCAIGPYNCGYTPSALHNNNAYYGKKMFLDAYDNNTGVHANSFTGWNINVVTSAITGYSKTVAVGNAPDSTHFFTYNVTANTDSSKTLTLNVIMAYNNFGSYNSGYTLGYSPSANSRITYKFDSPKIQINVDTTGLVKVGYSYCLGGELDVTENNIVTSTTSSYRKYTTSYYISTIIYEVNRSTGSPDGSSSGSTCSYDGSSCASNYGGCTGDGDYESGY